jgi:hypothetical protein
VYPFQFYLEYYGLHSSFTNPLTTSPLGHIQMNFTPGLLGSILTMKFFVGLSEADTGAP